MSYLEVEQLHRDLQSTDPAQIAAALSALEHSYDQLGWGFPVPPLELELLTRFGDRPPKEVLHSFVAAATNYGQFEPPFAEEALGRMLVELCLRYADSAVALETALWLKGCTQPATAVSAALAQIVGSGLTEPLATRGAQLLVSSLLDGNREVRGLTVAALRGFPHSAPYQAVIEYVRPQLEENEL